MIKYFITIFILFITLTFAQSKKVAVTFDDLPLNIALKISNEEMEKIVEKLIEKIKDEDIPVTAFVNENKLEVNGEVDPERVEVLKKWIEAGAELGNHTYSHKGAHNVSLREYLDDILKGEVITKQLLSEKNMKLKYFRHPFLHTGLTLEFRNKVEKILEEKGYKIAPVTFDNAEWIYASAYDHAFKAADKNLMEKVAKNYLNYMKENNRYFERQSEKLFNRQISQVLLLHSNRINADYFDKICEMMRDEGYEFVSLDEALQDEAYKTEDNFTGNNGISWLHRWAYSQGKEKEFFSGEPIPSQEILEIAGISKN